MKLIFITLHFVFYYIVVEARGAIESENTFREYISNLEHILKTFKDLNLKQVYFIYMHCIYENFLLRYCAMWHLFNIYAFLNTGS